MNRQAAKGRNCVAPCRLCALLVTSRTLTPVLSDASSISANPALSTERAQALTRATPAPASRSSTTTLRKPPVLPLCHVNSVPRRFTVSHAAPICSGPEKGGDGIEGGDARRPALEQRPHEKSEVPSRRTDATRRSQCLPILDGFMKRPRRERPLPRAAPHHPRSRNGGVHHAERSGEAVLKQCGIRRFCGGRESMAEQHEAEVAVTRPPAAQRGTRTRREEVFESLAIRVGACDATGRHWPLAPARCSRPSARPEVCVASSPRVMSATGAPCERKWSRGACRRWSRPGRELGEQHPRDALGTRPDFQVGPRLEADLRHAGVAPRHLSDDEPLMLPPQVATGPGCKIGVAVDDRLRHAGATDDPGQPFRSTRRATSRPA